MSDYLYENAPLVEVIAEFRWNLVPLTAIPGAAIDPYFHPASEAMKDALSKNGYISVERLVPPEVPIELVAGQPVLRFRTGANRWPLYQLGPGIFTCNIIPRYDGWAAFRKIISDGVDIFSSSYANLNKNLSLTRSDLRYIDAFTNKHGFRNYKDFVENDLGFEVKLKDGILERFGAGNLDLAANLEVGFNLRSPKGGRGFFKISPGKVREEPAVLMELRVTALSAGVPRASKTEILDWFDAAHTSLHDMFEVIVNGDLATRLGTKAEIPGGSNVTN